MHCVSLGFPTASGQVASYNRAPARVPLAHQLCPWHPEFSPGLGAADPSLGAELGFWPAAACKGSEAVPGGVREQPVPFPLGFLQPVVLPEKKRGNLGGRWCGGKVFLICFPSCPLSRDKSQVASTSITLLRPSRRVRILHLPPTPHTIPTRSPLLGRPKRRLGDPARATSRGLWGAEWLIRVMGARACG